MGATPKVEKKENRNPRTKKDNNKKSQQKKHFYHHFGVSWHTCPNCCKWLATQHSNSVLSFGGQDQIPPTLGSFGDLLKALMFLSNLNGFNSSLSPPEQRFTQRKCPSSKPKVWKEKGSKWFIHFISPIACISCLFVLLSCFWVSLVLCFVCFFMFLFGYFLVIFFFYFAFHKN